MPISGSDLALMFALSGVARAGATRAGHHSPKIFVAIGGEHRAYGKADPNFKVWDLVVTDRLNEMPNAAQFVAKGFTPTVGMDIIATLGSINNIERLFAGRLLTVAQAYRGRPSNKFYQVSAIDHTWGLNKTKVTGHFTGSATVIAKTLIATYAPGYDSPRVEANLPTVDGGVTFTNQDLTDCLTQLAKRIGAYWYCDYNKHVHLFISETINNPRALTAVHPSLVDFVVDRDLSQVVTRVFVEGGGAGALAAGPVGETILPVEDANWYQAGSGVVASGPQRITYGARSLGGGGTLVGPGIAPSSAPTAAVASGSGVDDGAHNYAYTFVTGAGETLPGPTAGVTVGPVTAPAEAPTNAGIAGTGNMDLSANYSYKFSYSTTETGFDYSSETTPSPASSAAQTTTGRMLVGNISYSTDSRVKWIYIYRTEGGGSIYKILGPVANDTAGGTYSFSDGVADGQLGAQTAPTSDSTAKRQVSLSAIAAGPSGTTQRKVYRTVAAGSQLKLLATIADNSTTIYTDSIADASLGANAPTSDTSGLTQPDGQVVAGATTLLVAGMAAFSAAGGWAVIGNGQQVIRYTGISGSQLTGIPTSGDGAITAAISYNSTVTAAPHLSGIPASGSGAIQKRILKGDSVNLFVQVDDTVAQAALSTLLTTAEGGAHNGIIEDYIQDRRLSYSEAQDRGEAHLALRKAIEVSVRYTSRDKNTRSGRTINVNLPAPTSVTGDFTIQDVTIANFQPAVFPDYSVSASSMRFSFEDLLRLARSA